MFLENIFKCEPQYSYKFIVIVKKSSVAVFRNELGMSKWLKCMTSFKFNSFMPVSVERCGTTALSAMIWDVFKCPLLLNTRFEQVSPLQAPPLQEPPASDSTFFSKSSLYLMKGSKDTSKIWSKKGEDEFKWNEKGGLDSQKSIISCETRDTNIEHKTKKYRSIKDGSMKEWRKW